jgi:ribosomal protein L37AE/L43A
MTSDNRRSVSASLSECDRCHSPLDPRRVAAGYNFCMICGDLLAQHTRRTIVPVHKSNYVLVTNRDDLKGINNKHQPT